jgi:two-component system OmpR family sensor kinase
VTRSLRGRLVLATLGLAAAGLLLADAATYGLLRTLLVRRLDQQVSAARFLALRELQPEGFREAGEGRVPEQFRVLLPPPPERRGFVPAGGLAELVEPDGSVRAVELGVGPETRASQRAPLAVGVIREASANGGAFFFTIEGRGGYRGLTSTLSDGSVLLAALPVTEMRGTLDRLLFAEASVTIVVLVLLAALGLWIVRLGLRPLEQMGDAAREIAGGDFSHRIEDANPRTEVGRLGQSLNRMMDEIERALDERAKSQERLRRFVADASHELRTPLTSIRGYAELFRRGAGSRPEDLEKSMRRIEDEAAHMGELVDELLLLAQLDQDRPLSLDVVDLAEIASDAVDTARDVEPDRPIDLVYTGPAEVLGDAARLRQVAANLLSNVRAHTPPRTPAEVSVRTGNGHAVLAVADRGPGIPADDLGRVFDRFWRADKARARSAGGSGLGLAIVAAIVQAHGGSVAAEATQGQGARITATLPLAPQPDARKEQGGEAVT